MSVEATKSLEQQIYRADLGDQPIKVQIKTLLYDLGSDENSAFLS
jgi:hypothetical protein